MASTERSLDDIIKDRRMVGTGARGRGRGGFRGGLRGRGGGVGIVTRAPRMVGDARNQIILKKRTKITDARDKLAEIAKQNDARVKLDKLRMRKGFIELHSVNTYNPNSKARLNRGFVDITRQVRPSPLPPLPQHPLSHHPLQHHPLSHHNPMSSEMTGYEMDVNMEDLYMPPPMKIVRSVNNDLSRYLPPPPDFSKSLPLKRPLRDKTVMSNRQTGLNLTVVAKNSDVRKPSSRERSRSHRYERPRSPLPEYTRERSPQPVSILKKRPSMVQSSRSHRPSFPSQSGYRILVSNLQSSVTGSDIHELFGDVGELLDSRLVRPGTAEIIFSRLEDAQKAVDVYHNRQLDGQPMNCFLVNPRTPQTSSSSRSNSSKLRPGANLPASSNSSVVPDISTFYKVLFGKE